MEHQFIGADRELGAWQHLFIGAAILIGHKGAQMRAPVAFDAEQLDRHARRRATARRIQHMCRQISGHSLSSVNVAWSDCTRS